MDQIARSTEQTYQPDALVIGGQEDYSTGTLASGQNLTRGAILGRVTSGGALVLSESDAVDGSQVPIGALAHDCDASAGAQTCQFVRGGHLNEHAINFDDSWTVASLNASFDRTPLLIVKPL